MVAATAALAERLDATLVNMRFVKPLDQDLVIRIAGRHESIVTVEENVVAGGAGSAVVELLNEQGYVRPVLQLGLPDRNIEHGSRADNLAAAGLDPASLAASIERWWQPARRRAAPAT
jgi:1-deoxy-D-xylulose-5-phosphate synthase